MTKNWDVTIRSVGGRAWRSSIALVVRGFDHSLIEMGPITCGLIFIGGEIDDDHVSLRNARQANDFLGLLPLLHGEARGDDLQIATPHANLLSALQLRDEARPLWEPRDRLAKHPIEMLHFAETLHDRIRSLTEQRRRR